MRMKTLTCLGAAALMALPTIASAQDPAPAADAAAEQTYRLKIRTVAPKASPWGKLLVKLARNLKKESAGRIKVKVYWQSKSEPAAVRQCLRGKVGGIAVSNGALSSAVPELMATEMPYLFDNYGQADRAFSASAPIMKEIMGNAGFIYALRGENGFRHFASKDGFITSPGDLAGKKMRSQPAKNHLAMYKALGATPSPIQVAEVPTSLANNTVTGYDNTLLFGKLANWADNIKYVSLSGHIYQGAVIAWCKPWFDGLPADLQAILTKSRPKLEKVGLKLVRAFNDKKMPSQYADAGIEVKSLSGGQKAAFKSATASVESEFRGATTEAGRKLLDSLKNNR